MLKKFYTVGIELLVSVSVGEGIVIFWVLKVLLWLFGDLWGLGDWVLRLL
jgi:hypothetical protein